MAGSIAFGALPATAGDSHTVQYVALGDSYAAGQGGGEHFDEICKQTAAAYPEQLDARKHVHLRANVGCSGATTLKVINTQVSALDADWTTLVTLTVGANDLGVASVAAACTAVPPTNCQAAVANALSQLTPLAGSLANLYPAVATAAPRALILVTGYPYLFETPTPCISPTDSIVCQIRYATTLLNQTIEDTVEAAKIAGVNIEYVDVTAAFAGHGIYGDQDLFINDSGPDAYHPNGKGYEAYASALSAALD
jgi:lysophospholipase L1-like esterase